MLGCVINGKPVWMVDKDCPCAFEYKGGYFVSEKDYPKAYQYYNKEEDTKDGN